MLKDLALNKTRKQTKGGSRPCEPCALCGCYGKNNKSMVPNVSQLLTKTKTLKLNLSLTCADCGIYVATCVICHEQYVGQTSNKFSKRWSAHRSNWNKQDCKTDSDKDQMCRGTIQRTTALQTSHLCTKHTPLLLSNNQVVTFWTSMFVKPHQWPTPSESIAIYCVRKLVSCVTHLQSCAKVDIWNVDPPTCEIIITMLSVVWLNPMLSSGLCASFSLNTACLLPPKRTRGRFKRVPQRLTARTWLTIFSTVVSHFTKS